MQLQCMKNMQGHLPVPPRHVQRKPNRGMEVIRHPICTTVLPDAGRALMLMMPWQSCQTMRQSRAAQRGLPCR